MADKVSLDIEGKSITISKSILQQFTYFESIIERWHFKSEPIFIDCDHKLFRHLLNIVRIPDYTVPITELDNITKLADYYGLKIKIPKCPKTKIVTGTLYDLHNRKNVISGVTHMLFHNILESDRSLLNSPYIKLKIDFEIQYKNNLTTVDVNENIFMIRKPHMKTKHLVHIEQKIICPEFLPLFQEPFTISALPKNKLTENVRVTIIC